MQRLHRVVQDIAGQDTSADASVLKSVLRHLPYAAFIVQRPDRGIAWCNAAVERLLGYDAEALIGGTTQILHIDDRHFREFTERSSPLVSNGWPFSGRYWLRHRQGHLIPTDHLVTPVQSIAGHPAVVSFVQSLYGSESALTAKAYERLSHAERAVFDLMRQGYSAKKAARALGVSPRTVEVHRGKVLAKLGYDSTTELMAALLEAKAAFSGSE